MSKYEELRIKLCKLRIFLAQKIRGIIKDKNEKEISIFFEHIFCYVFAVALTLVCIRRIEGIVNFIKNGMLVFGGSELVNIVRFLADNFIIPISYWLIGISLILVLINKGFIIVYCFIKNREKKGCSFENKYEQAIYHFLEHPSNKTCLVVEGGWGAGKTYVLKKFLDKYMRYKLYPCYTISCFGLSEREQIIDTIKEECRIQDKSIRKTLIGCLRFIPVVGEAMCSLLERKYEFSSFKKDTVFVFEDFERISCSEEPSADKAIKYNLFAGFINDLYENYKFRIIIVCNKKEITEEIFTNLLWDKMKCEVVTIKGMASEAYSVASKIVNDEIALNETEKRKILIVIEREINNLIELFFKADITNIRNVERIFESIFKNVKFDSELEMYEYKNRCVIYAIIYKELFNKIKKRVQLTPGKTYFENYLDIVYDSSIEINANEAKILLCAPHDLFYCDEKDSLIEGVATAQLFDNIIKYGLKENDKLDSYALFLSITYLIKEDKDSGIIGDYIALLNLSIQIDDSYRLPIDLIYKAYKYLKPIPFYDIYIVLKNYIETFRREGKDEKMDYSDVKEKRMAEEIIESMEQYENQLLWNDYNNLI